jgi:hypothetical protein
MGLEPMPLGPAGSMLLIAGCCQPAIGAGMHARSVGTRFPHSPRRSTGTQRTCAKSQPRPCFGCEQPDASGRNEFRKPAVMQRVSIHRYPLQTPKTKRPRVWRPEGVRVASGDRGDRSPRRDQSIIGKSVARSCLSSRTDRPASRPLRDVYGLFKLARRKDMKNFFFGLSPGWRRTRTIRALIIWCKRFY